MERDRAAPPPPAVRTVAGGRPLSLVWENAVGGRTYRFERDGGRYFVKWLPRESGLDATAEVVRLHWARPYSAVPRLVARGADPAGEWMLTEALPGESAVAPRWLADPEAAVVAIGRGLRELHEALPVASCPFSWQAQDRVADARARAHCGRLDRGQWHAEHARLSLDEALQRVATPPRLDRLVVCHGDACAPNTLIDERGACSGHTDLGCLGVADRWADIAVATWSTVWNYGEGFEARLLDAYGVDPDPQRSAYYRLLWDLGP